MAIKHLCLKKGLIGRGKAHALYIAGQGPYAARHDLVHLEEFNLPTWAQNGIDFFAAADVRERANGRAYLEVEFSIPREALNSVEFARTFAIQLLGQNFPFTLAVHNRPASDGGNNIHAHLMFSDRQLDGVERPVTLFFRRANNKCPETGGCKKDRRWNARERVQQLRDQYEEFVRKTCEIENFSMKKSLNPEPKIGPNLQRASSRYHAYRALAVAKVQGLRNARRELSDLDRQIEHVANSSFDRAERLLSLRQEMGFTSKPSFSSILSPSHSAIELAHESSVTPEQCLNPMHR